MKLVHAVPGVLVVSVGCGTASSPYTLEIGVDDAGGTFTPGDAAGAQTLDAHVEQGGVAVTLVTLSCSGDCATVQAVGTGGHPPYTYAWENGSTNPVRQVCPTADTRYSVKVTDTGENGEFPRPPQTANASVTADVLACRDAGSPTGGGLCISNPSLEGTAPSVCLFAQLDAPPWSLCGNAADQACLLGAGSSISGAPAPSDGLTYLVLAPPYTALGNEFVSEPLCAPALSGTPYSVRFDLNAFQSASSGDAGPPVSQELQIWGSNSSCSETELLWTSTPIPVGAGWKTYCATFTPRQGASNLALASIITPGTNTASVSSTWLGIDHIVPVAACTP